MKDIERLINYYAAGRLFLGRPRHLCFNATLRCDGRCSHCGIWRDKGKTTEIGARELARALSSPLFSKVETAWITGGEPTLRDDFGEVSRALVDSLPSLVTIGVATNGFDPARTIERVAAMRAAAADRHSVFAHVSLDGVGEVHDRARDREGLFEAVEQTIKRLMELRDRGDGPKLEIGLNCVIQPANVDGLDELHSYARDLGLPITFNVALVTDQIYRNQDRADELTLSKEDREKISSFLDRIMPESPRPFQYQYEIIKAVLKGRPRPRRCLTLYTTININADGSLIPCPASSDVFPKNVTKEDPEAIWRGREARLMRARVHGEFCPSCMLSCSLGDSMPVGEYFKGGWDK